MQVRAINHQMQEIVDFFWKVMKPFMPGKYNQNLFFRFIGTISLDT